MAIIMVAVADINNGIGDADGNLLFNLPKDMKRFKELTVNKHIVMGRKTWDSLQKKPLPKRKNYILTTNEDFKAEGRAKVLHSIEEVLEMSKKGDVYICGGGELYYQFMPYADTLYLTHVHTIDFKARTFFPEVSPKEWKLTKAVKHEPDEKNPHSFTFAEYNRKDNTAN